MNKLRRKKINIKDVLYVLDNLREEDREEVFYTFGPDYKKELIKSILFYSKTSKLAIDSKNKKPVFIYGVCPLEDNQGVGQIYMLSTPEIVKFKRSFFFELKKELQFFDSKYYYLFNIIYKKNFLSKKWLKSSGFKFDLPKPTGMNLSDDYEYFYRIRKTDNKKGLY